MPKTSAYAREPNDWYVEPAWCADAIFEHLRFEHPIHDPACGGGNIVASARRHGVEATGADIVDRQTDFPVIDYFQDTNTHDNIVSNPPYKHLEAFVEHALSHTRYNVVFLAPLSFLEGQQRQLRLFSKHKLAQVLVSSRRVSMPPGGTDIKPTGGTKAFAWFVWDNNYNPYPLIRWF